MRIKTSRIGWESQYSTNKYGTIIDPGKFEGEPLYVPYYWEQYLNGFATDDDGDHIFFEISDEDIEVFPELKGLKWIFLWSDESGFVYHNFSVQGPDYANVS